MLELHVSWVFRSQAPRLKLTPSFSLANPASDHVVIPTCTCVPSCKVSNWGLEYKFKKKKKQIETGFLWISLKPMHWKTPKTKPLAQSPLPPKACWDNGERGWSLPSRRESGSANTLGENFSLPKIQRHHVSESSPSLELPFSPSMWECCPLPPKCSQQFDNYCRHF